MRPATQHSFAAQRETIEGWPNDAPTADGRGTSSFDKERLGVCAPADRLQSKIGHGSERRRDEAGNVAAGERPLHAGMLHTAARIEQIEVAGNSRLPSEACETRKKALPAMNEHCDLPTNETNCTDTVGPTRQLSARVARPLDAI